MKHVKTFEGFFSNLFGGEKSTKSDSSSSDSSSKERKEVYRCSSLYAGEVKYGFYFDKGVKVSVAYVSLGQQGGDDARKLNAEGYKNSGEACPGDLQDIF